VLHRLLDRVSVTPAGRSRAAGGGGAASALLRLQQRIGNQAVQRLVAGRPLQRAVGWTGDVVTEGYGWNTGEKAVGHVRRIPLEGLSEGLQQESAQVWNKDKQEFETESTKVKSLSPESAKGRAIVLVPDGLDATKKIEVVVFLHGYTEGSFRPFAGWRTLKMPAAGKPRPGQKKSADDEQLERLRGGIDAGDTAPVRDVALDQAEQQLEESGQSQLVIVLPQGGLHSQFGKAGTATFDASTYVAQIVGRLLTEKVWTDGAGAPVSTAPDVARLTMAGHSGAGATLADMAKKDKISGDLVLYDAINGPGELGAFKTWALAHLDADLAVLADPGKSDADKLDYLGKAQKLRGYHSNSSGYKAQYALLQTAIDGWFKTHAKQLGAWAASLRANYVLTHVPVAHEELMRGVAAGTARAGAGSIADAIRGLHAAPVAPPAPAGVP
jgi:hypothetical protein